jgi:uncharacterized protein YecT (DUF1311 family)
MRASAFAALITAAAMAALGGCQKAKESAAPAPVAVKQAAWAAFALPELSGTADFSTDRTRVATCISAANAGKIETDSCIGVVSTPCLETDTEDSTASMVECLDRETAVWGALMSETESQLNAKSVKVSDALGIAHKAFFANRDAQCALPYATHEGATIAHVLSAQCANDLTARQVLRLQQQLTVK